jgi:DNA-binding beta-propeller fold protein YncE
MKLSSKSMSIATAAGTGEPGYLGDGGPAGAAALNEPKGLTVDARGDVYIADSENHVIRKIDRWTGRIVTIAGCSYPAHQATEHPAALAGVINADDDPLGEQSGDSPRLFSQVADLSGTVRFVTPHSVGTIRFAGDGGPATDALLNFPTAVAVDADGNLYIADTMNHRIRMVDVASGGISTIAGTGYPRYGGDGGPAVSAGLQDPAALAIDHLGRLYIADQSNHRIRAIDLQTGRISTIAGTGTAAYNGDNIPAVEACLAGPSGLAIGSDGVLYVADTFNGRVRAIDLQTGMIHTVAGDGSEYRFSDDAQESVALSRPYGIAIDRDGNILITDSDNHLLRIFDRTKGTTRRLAGVGNASYSGDGGPAEAAALNYPFGVALDEEGKVFVADTFNHRIRRLVSEPL